MLHAGTRRRRAVLSDPAGPEKGVSRRPGNPFRFARPGDVAAALR